MDIGYSNLVVDKIKDDLIAYNDEKHVYWNVKTHQRYTSVTTLIGRYQPQFDSEFMSLKCAQRDVRKGLTNLSVEDRRQELLQQWAEKNRTVSDNGTRLHLMLEGYLMYMNGDIENGNSYSRSIIKYELTSDEIIYLDYVRDLMLHKCDKLILEDLLYMHDYNIAGQSDVVRIVNGKVYIDDWKFNSKPLTWEGYNGQKMLFPLDNFQNSKLHTYQLQASIYMYFKCKETGLKPGKICIHHFLDGVCTPHHFDYIEEDVIRLLEYNFNKRTMPEYKNIDIFVGRKSFDASGNVVIITSLNEDNTYNLTINKREIDNVVESEVRKIMSLPTPFKQENLWQTA